MSKSIDHSGIIEKIEGNQIFVKIVQQSACADCHAKGICSSSDSQDKVIEVTDLSGTWRINEQVLICGQTSIGLQAVWLAFVIPLICMLAAIVTGTFFEWGDAFSGLIGLLILIPYYVILYCFRDKLKKKFVFTLKKLN